MITKNELKGSRQIEMDGNVVRYAKTPTTVCHNITIDELMRVLNEVMVSIIFQVIVPRGGLAIMLNTIRILQSSPNVSIPSSSFFSF